MKARRFHRISWLVTLAAAALFASAPAHANMVLTLISVGAAAGSTGNSFDVTIQNTGASAQNIAAFSLGLSVADTHITFTGGNEFTALTYVFNGDSFDVINGFAYTTIPPPTGHQVEGVDNSNSGAGTDIAAGATLGLGHIFFDVAANTSAGPIAVTIAPGCGNPLCTTLSDSAGATVLFAVTNGDITVTTSTVVPEPSTFLLALCALPAIARRRRK